MALQTLAIDVETYSSLDINRVGFYKYAENCEVLLLAYAFDDEPVQIVDLAMGEECPSVLTEALFNPRILKTAYNAAFEINVLSKYFGRQIDSSEWQCTMVMGVRLGLPAGLDEIGQVLNLDSDKRKLKTGKKLIQFFSTPRKSKKSKKEPVAAAGQLSLWDDTVNNRNLPKYNLDKWAEFKEYCMQDVESERAIRKRLSAYDSAPQTEKHLWKLDQTINDNGVWVDMELVRSAIKVEAALKEELLQKGEQITGGLNLNSNKQMLHWMEQLEGRPVTSLSKEARQELLASVENPKVREFLEIKSQLSKISVKKYEAMEMTACEDHRIRGMFKFHGASRTGRWSGWGVQLQNLPQNRIADLDDARRFVLKGNYIALQIFYEKPLDVLSQLIRTAFVAADGHRFIVADFSSIEARILSWLAEEEWRLKVFEEGGDIYCASASEMFKVPVEKHGANKELRAKGKVAELACGYGGGVAALKAFGADKMGLSEDDMKSIIAKWRIVNPKISRFWRIMEFCAKIAIREKRKKFCRKGIAFEYRDDFLFIHLPSGRCISYYKPQLVVDSNTGREYIVYEGYRQSSNSHRIWGKVSTWGGKIVENIVQAIARDCLAMTMLRLSAKGYKIVMHVHDEVILEMPNDVGSLDEVLSIMRMPMWWANDLRLNAEGYETQYYRKDN